jgi:hypothetical protein
MTIRHWCVLGALAFAQLPAVAQQASEPRRAQDEQAAVPALAYRSAFEGFSSASSGQEATPDKVWREANKQVANPGAGHAQHAPKGDAAAPAQPAQKPAAPEHKHQH